jgi:hypothetical protein
MMGFRKVPLWLLFSPIVSQLSSFQRDLLMFAQLARDARNCLPYDAPLLRSVVFPARAFVGLKDIAAARDHLVALGVFLRKATHRKEWLEIAPEYRNDDGQNETSFGDAEPPPAQGELLFPPQLVPPAAASAQPAEKRKEKSRANDSARRGAQTRQRSLKEDSGEAAAPPLRFARGEEDVPGGLWADLYRTVGAPEMLQNGALWEGRTREDRPALVAALQEFLLKPAAQRAEYNAAAYITSVYERLRERSA